MAVTSRASRDAPATVVAHLSRWTKSRRIHQSMKPFRAKIVIAVLLSGAIFVGFEIASAANALGFNRKLEQKVNQHQLIGKTEKEVIAILGRPSSRVVYREGDFTLNYFPAALLPMNKFQAHFRSAGTLRSIELMD